MPLLLMKKALHIIFGFMLVVSVLSCDYEMKTLQLLSDAPNEPETVIVNEELPMALLMDSLKIKQHNISMLIDKSELTLNVLNKEAIIKSYQIVLGSNPIDDKRMEGDRCTPEGTFHIVSKYPHKNWRKFIWIDYPNDESRRKFNKSKLDGEIPKDAEIGGEVGIHGTPEDGDYLIDDKVNWTWGCISLKRNDVDEIYPYINEGTEIIIVK